MVTKRQKQQTPLSRATFPLDAQASKTDDAPNASLLDYSQLFLRLLNVGQVLCQQTHGVADRFCQEVALITQRHAQLFLRHQNPSRAELSPPPSSVSFPVEFRGIIYGTLYIAPDPAQPAFLALPLAIAHLLAQTCACLLYAFELSAFLQGQYRHLDHQVQGALTKREREVLILMCRGYDRKAIAKALSIASATVDKHRQQIYKQLDVHCERDALLVAYQFGLFSPLAEILN
jgi:DNA-binding CsgD family transcriptional regulator